VANKTKTVATFTPDTSNTLFQLAADLINQSGRNIFLTGKAGTGKTTFLKYIRENCPKQMAVLAPTGVAAINAGGVTIHSFFQLPFAPFVPQAKGFSGSTESVNPHNLISRLRFNEEKRKVLQQLELLVIDEVSMVRCDIIDAIDMILRHFRKRPYEKFGGVQLLFIGDMFQLPPVIKDAEWKILGEYYDSPYFFSSYALKEEAPLYIEFNKIYRQSEETFIRVLNQVRNNELDEYGLNILESRYQPTVRRSKNDQYIILTTHNEQARNINTAELHQLPSPVVTYEAEIKNDFPENAYPADQSLHLKEGAQVMFIKNDTAERGKRYFNGKIGVVAALEDSKITVVCPDEPAIEVTKEEWENIRYSFDKSTQQVKEDVLGSFTQFPLRLAWAITIHKSQGLTFDKAIIDAGEAFAPGQVYVALSRCTSLDGLVLKSKVRPNSLFIDNRIVEFSQKASAATALQEELKASARQYQEKLLTTTYDFRLPADQLIQLKEYIAEHNNSFNDETSSWLEQLITQLSQLQDVAIKFHGFLNNQYKEPIAPEENKSLQNRIQKAAHYFITEIDSIIQNMQASPANTDSKMHAKEYNDRMKAVFSQLALTRHMLRGLGFPFSIQQWHQQKRSFVVPGFSVNAYATASTAVPTNTLHPLLYKKLRQMRDQISSRKDIPIYRVIRNTAIDEMVLYLPQSLGELKKIKGFGSSKLEQYGQSFLDIVLEYCHEHNLDSLIANKPPKKEQDPAEPSGTKTGETYNESFRLYKQGLPIAEIAKERNLAISTIETHLAKFVRFGHIKIEDLVSPDKIALITSALDGFEGGSITPVYQKAGNKVSFGEIRMVMASMGISS
jgi:hypothetical protein